MAEGYKLREVKEVNDLDETGNIWWLELYAFEDVKGKYVIDDRQVTTYEPEGTKTAEVMMNVDNRVYGVEAEVDIVGNELYIAEEEIGRLF